jgi:predicted nucleotidyltransferase
MRGSVQDTLAVLKRELRDLYGDKLQGLYLYGSHARGTAHEGSDIDVLLVLQGMVKPGEEINQISSTVSDLCLLSGLLISIYPVSTTWFRTRQSPFFTNVRKEVIPL